MQLLAAKRLARQLMADHHLTNWTFRFDNARRRFGQCQHRARVITLSRHFVELNDEPRVRQTILHEIAHAIAGGAAGHGPVWQAHALRLGTSPERCYSTDDTVAPNAPLIGRCPNCALEIERFKRKRIACKRCCRQHNGGRFSPEYLFQWHHKEV